MTEDLKIRATLCLRIQVVRADRTEYGKKWSKFSKLPHSAKVVEGAERAVILLPRSVIARCAERILVRGLDVPVKWTVAKCKTNVSDPLW